MKTKERTVADTLAALAIHAPALAFETLWEHDPFCECDWREMTGPGYCFHGEDRDDWQPWQSEVKVSAIVAGQIVTGSGYLGGTWEEAGADPAESNPDISGYWWNKAGEALKEIEAGFSATPRDLSHYPDLRDQIDRARQVLAGNLD